jgi:hypothetical protein
LVTDKRAEANKMANSSSAAEAVSHQRVDTRAVIF